MNIKCIRKGRKLMKKPKNVTLVFSQFSYFISASALRQIRSKLLGKTTLTVCILYILQLELNF